jgi:steroid-24-oyl-CoA synthetase
VRLWPGQEADEEQLRASAAEQLAPFQVPAHIWLVTEPFPRNGAGKMLKRELRARFVGEATGS